MDESFLRRSTVAGAQRESGGASAASVKRHIALLWRQSR
jgi:hypothetical protein